MNDTPGTKRKDSASRIIQAPASKIYHAFLDKEAIAAWRPPSGMKCYVFSFQPYEGGTFRMAFSYTEEIHDVKGKTSEHADIFHGIFRELVPDKRIVELIEFETGDPSFAGIMKITTTLTPVDDGTEVTFLAENVPVGIRPEDHYKGMTSTLDNLAVFVE